MAGKKVVEMILKTMTEVRCFDTPILQKLNILDAGDGKCSAEMTVEPEHQNRGGTLHGGCTATLVDMISTLALMTHERQQPGVSVDMHITYMKAAKTGDTVVIDAVTQKVGRSLAFLNVDIRNKATGDLIAQGSHTKYVS